MPSDANMHLCIISLYLFLINHNAAKVIWTITSKWLSYFQSTTWSDLEVKSLG